MKYIAVFILMGVLYPGLPNTWNLTTLALGFLFGITLAFCLMDMASFMEEK